ncbi:MAG: cytochrome c-type biogenesis protein CcmH [Gammaproteobacteria bacterium]|jgi:cytochrome c-type biogenesis protein CcmH|nr:cytochrome c-type biogenesis protein CcmH [Gammaproteobacteria bacterium]
MNKYKIIVLMASLLSSSFLFAWDEKFVFETQQQQQDFEYILKELRCVTCPNQNIADSYAPIAKAMQEEVYVRIKRGENLETIREYLLSHYGNYVFYKPLMTEQNYILWFGPFGMLLVGGLMWFAFFKKSHPLPNPPPQTGEGIR